jgi:dTDP-4-amino-4,6-dideoxygalactose transaminase
MASAVKMNVPFLDIKEQNRRILPELRQALDGVISQAQFILGPPVERFEKAFSAYLGR